MKAKELIKNIHLQILDSESFGVGQDSASWGMQEGILLSINEAKTLLQAIQSQEWVSVEERLPEELQTVWVTNGKGWTTLGCRVYNGENWCWAETNGVIYEEKRVIVAECEAEDLDVKFWMSLPTPPNR